MADLSEMKDELQQGLNRLEQEQALFLDEMSAKIDAAEQSLILEALAKMDKRLSAIEKRLFEPDPEATAKTASIR